MSLFLKLDVGTLRHKEKPKLDVQNTQVYVFVCISNRYRMKLRRGSVIKEWGTRWARVRAEAAVRIQCLLRRHFALKAYAYLRY